MRLFLTTLLLFFSVYSFAARVTIEVRDAYDDSRIIDAELKIYYESRGMSKKANLNKRGTFTFKVRRPVLVTASISDDRYFGQSLHLTPGDNGSNQTVYVYPTQEYDQILLEEAGCKIAEKKPLSTLEQESEELKSLEKDDTPDQEAFFPGGTKEMKRYLSNTIRYPQLSMELGDEAKVYIEFIVNKDGSISCVQPKNEAPLHIVAESLRVVRMMPNWDPAKHNGENVRARCRLPINFKLQ